MFIADLFIIVQPWKQPRCPLVGTWIKTVIQPDNGVLFNNKKEMIYYLEKTWRKLKCMLLSERVKSVKASYYMIPMI